MKARTDQIKLPWLTDYGIELYLRREDLLMPALSGNKYRKLKFNLEEAKRRGLSRLLTFGGAYSNHIHATAAAGKLFGFEAVGFIRGDELSARQLNPTLQDAQDNGMQLIFLSRSEYDKRHFQDFQDQLLKLYGPGYVIPEGGTNDFAIAGCAEILQPVDVEYNLICCAVGTGGTLAGLVRSSGTPQKVRGYMALKGVGFRSQLETIIPHRNWELVDRYHFGGYAKVTRELIAFVNDFKSQTGVTLDPVYTGKLIYGILDDIRNFRIPSNSKILAIHTGGLQGIRGINQQLAKKALPLLEL
jgi:1-aminocyclopropane-1-carboxylate deaminase